ncbi:uncharacterized protein [Acropora muricata]|uniref:uncharacterized protein n=1 Tax=Acropora muricata TaxID=159855 RepID=UPI0034E5797B
MVSKLSVRASARDLLFRDLDNFTAGKIHVHLPRWDVILQGHNKRDEILSYLKIGVDVHDFFLPLRGDFQGTYYDLAFPPSIKFSNIKSCAGVEDFINKTILERLANRSLSIWGKVGFVSSPHLVMPLTVEPTKPRLCHDERFLNLWIRDLPLTLDYICNLPRYVAHNHFQSTMDDKSGYDHVRLSPKSRTYFGLEWCGWYVHNRTPFDWKASAYLYHTIGMAATSYARSLGVPCSQYIDDRHVGQLALCHRPSKPDIEWSNLEYADAAAFILISLGFFIGLSKSSLAPRQVNVFRIYRGLYSLCLFNPGGQEKEIRRSA